MLVLERYVDIETNKYMLSVKFNYSNFYIDRIKNVPQAFFNGESKKWCFPIRSLPYFEEKFKGEIFYKTPRWVILKKPIPDYSAMYKIPDYRIPELKIELFDYQKFGFKFILHRLYKYGFSILCDEMGLGKTPQSITVAKYLIENDNVTKVLVLCKKSLKDQWAEEIDKFTDLCSKMDVTVISGTKKKREKLYKNFTNGFLIVNYQTGYHDKDFLKKIGFDLCIGDEIHYIKNKDGVMNKAFSKFLNDVKYSILMTGTPIMSKPKDIFGIMQLVSNNYFGPYYKFEKKYLIVEYNGDYPKEIGVKNLDELRDKVQDVILRRTSHEVKIKGGMPKLSPPINIMCDMDNTQIALAKAIKFKKDQYKDTLTKIKNKSFIDDKLRKIQISIDGAMKGLLSSEQALADDPRLFRMSKSKQIIKDFGNLIPENYKRSDKVERLIDIMDEFRENDEKVIIFVKFERTIRILKQELEKAYKGMKVATYYGDLKDEDRKLQVRLFTFDDDCNVFISTDAGAEGINLQFSKAVIHFDQADTPAIMDQRNGRARRIGAKHNVISVINLLTKDSRDIERYNNILKARNIFDGLISINEGQSVALIEAMK